MTLSVRGFSEVTFIKNCLPTTVSRQGPGRLDRLSFEEEVASDLDRNNAIARRTCRNQLAMGKRYFKL